MRGVISGVPLSRSIEDIDIVSDIVTLCQRKELRLCGICRGRSAIDALVKMSRPNDVEKTLQMNEIMAVLYLDIEKVYIYM